jgi:hypothetical protein
VTQAHDPVNHPRHYTAHPSGVECIDLTEHLPFCLGNALKYLWRAGLKTSAAEDRAKAVWYLRREAARRQTTPLLVPMPVSRLALAVLAFETPATALGMVLASLSQASIEGYLLENIARMIEAGAVP